MAHVVPRHLGPDASTAHQARMHRAEAPKVHSLRQSKFLDRRFEMPTQQIAPVHRASSRVVEDQISRFPMLRSQPNCIQNGPQDSVRIKWYAPATSIGFGIVKLS